MVAKGLSNFVAKADQVACSLQLKFSLTHRQFQGIKYLLLGEDLCNAAYQNLNKISKATATRDLQQLVRSGILQVTGKGAGAKYKMVETAIEKEAIIGSDLTENWLMG